MRPAIEDCRGKCTRSAHDTWQALGQLATAIAQDDPTELSPYVPALTTPQEIHAFVQRRVRFLDGPVQRWARPERTIRGGYGDCGNSTRATISLARLAGLPSRLRWFTSSVRGVGPLGARPRPFPVHVVAEIGDLANRWHWAEASIPARFGEHPLRAAARLGIMADLKEDKRSILVPDDTPTTPALRKPRIGQVQVPSTATPVTPTDMWSAMGDAWLTQFGTPPTHDQLMVLLAQWGLETGNGASMIQNNVGNFKHVDGDGLDWTTFETTEVVNGETETLDQNFKAWPDLDSGVAYYMQSLAPPSGRFAAAWPAVLAGDTDQFAYLLKQQGYYTADEATYAAGLDARKQQFEALDLPDPALASVGDVASSNLPTILLLAAAGAGATWVAVDQGWIPDPIAGLGFLWSGFTGLVGSV
jgi:Transglutaminase-like superfamily